MQSIKANIIDVIQKKIYPACIFFDTHIRKIEPLSDVLDTYVLPGLVDAHVHIESSMLPPSEFARLAVPHGTLAVVSDPHEIANVLGIDGINFMIDNAMKVPFRFVFGAPSCVPATSFETAGATITAGDIDELFRTGKVGFLSEMMNFPGVIHQNPEIMAKIMVARQYGKPIDGHAPGLVGKALHEYIQAGITTDHECSTLGEAKEKINLGMKILVREGSAAKNYDALFSLIDSDPDQVMLCTDDEHPDDLLRGHINLLLAKGIASGLDLFNLLRAATLNPIRHYQIDLGLLQLGDPADFVIVNNLKDFSIQQSFFRGNCLFKRVGEEPVSIPALSDATHQIDSVYPNRFGAVKISAMDIQVVALSSKMKVMQTFDGNLYTKQIVCDVQKGFVLASDLETDILKIVVLNRYQQAKPAVAFIRGFRLKRGALASTVAHDSHHIIAVGCDDHSIVVAINHIIDIKGGLAAYYSENLIDLKLDIAGLMSSSSGSKVAHEYELLNSAASVMGCTLASPFMTLSFMALLVIPELKLGDKGLFDVNRFEWTDLFKV